MILLVGERMNLGRDWRPRLSSDDSIELRLRLGAFKTPASVRSLVACGLRWDRALNLLWPSTSNSWDADLARAVASRLLDLETGLIIAAGRRVAAAFGLGEVVIPSRWRVRSRWVLVVPHPSGLNRMWNDPATYDRVRELWSAHERMAQAEAASRPGPPDEVLEPVRRRGVRPRIRKVGGSSTPVGPRPGRP